MYVPRKASRQQQRHPRSNHPAWKMHALLGCSAQSPQARKSAAKFIVRAMTMKMRDTMTE